MKATAELRVVIIDDHELLARMLERALASSGIAATSVTGRQLADALEVARQFRPDVVLLDVDLGAGADAAALIPELVGAGCRVLLLTGSRDLVALGTLVELGAHGVLSKDEPPESVVESVHEAVTAGGGSISASVHHCLQALRERRAHDRRVNAPFERLSRREQEVLAALIGGQSAAAIAEASFVSLSTVRSQIRSVLTKLGVTSQLAAVAMANEAGWS
jgi:DNA-binding NarL/FixJ family response regulator